MTDYVEKFEAAVPLKTIERSYDLISHTPDRRAVSAQEDASAWLTRVMPLVDEAERDQVFERWLRLYQARTAARGRTASPMITGPARFPVDRNRKALDAEMNHINRLVEFEKRVEAKIAKRDRPETVIKSDDPDAVGKLKIKIAQLRGELEDRKRWNAQFRKGGVDAMDAPEDEKTRLRAYLERNPGPYVPYFLNNKRAEIKRCEDRVTVLERNSQVPAAERQLTDDCKMVINPGVNRVQLVFGGKPEADLRTRLKRRGFRWSPREGAWQRHYSAAAIADGREAVLGDGR